MKRKAPKKYLVLEASEAEILTLIEETDRLADVLNSLRPGKPVTLRGAQSISIQI